MIRPGPDVRASFWPGLACEDASGGGKEPCWRRPTPCGLQRRADELVERIAGLSGAPVYGYARS